MSGRATIHSVTLTAPPTTKSRTDISATPTCILFYYSSCNISLHFQTKQKNRRKPPFKISILTNFRLCSPCSVTSKQSVSVTVAVRNIIIMFCKIYGVKNANIYQTFGSKITVQVPRSCYLRDLAVFVLQ